MNKAPENNTIKYFLAQSVGAASPPIIISLGGLVSIYLGAPREFSTLPVFLFNLGVALSTLPAAYMMRKFGRKTSYISAAIVSVFAAMLSTFSIFTASFWIFCLSTFMAGYYAANVASYRFAVTDDLNPEQHSKAISRVMIGGLVAAVIGPQIVLWTQDAFATATYAGSFIGQACIGLIAIAVLLTLKTKENTHSAQSTKNHDVSISTLLTRPRYTIAVAAGVVSYALMAFIMTAAPIAMVDHGHSVGNAALGIQWHILGMFAPSLITGKLMARFGKARITAIGLFLIAASGFVSLFGMELAHFWGTLILLGVGWNFGYIGATALVSESHSAEEKSLAQGLNDFLIFSTVATGSFMAGVVLNSSGWYTLNLTVIPICAVVLGLMLLSHRYENNRNNEAA